MNKIKKELVDLSEYGWDIHQDVVDGKISSFNAYMQLLREIDSIIKYIEKLEK
jgi:hypothetical protein